MKEGLWNFSISPVSVLFSYPQWHSRRRECSRQLPPASFSGSHSDFVYTRCFLGYLRGWCAGRRPGVLREWVESDGKNLCLFFSPNVPSPRLFYGICCDLPRMEVREPGKQTQTLESNGPEFKSWGSHPLMGWSMKSLLPTLHSSPVSE